MSIFDDPDRLRQLWARPPDPSHEPVANFPLAYYDFFLREIRRLGVQVITYEDLFESSADWDYKSGYPEECWTWKHRKRDPERIYLLIQHDVDNHPFFTKRMVAMEAQHGIRSNIFLFRDRYSSDEGRASYDVDHDFFRQAERQGFVIGYHQNALALCGFDLAKAEQRYRSDVKYLRSIYDIGFVVPHGGAGGVADGRPVYNRDVPIPEEFQNNLRWVYNRYGVTFSKTWSDGGLRKTRDAKRIRNFDLVHHFLHKLKPGNRYFCLVHPQRWGYNVDMNQNPLLAAERWYREICTGQR